MFLVVGVSMTWCAGCDYECVSYSVCHGVFRTCLYKCDCVSVCFRPVVSELFCLSIH